MAKNQPYILVSGSSGLIGSAVVRRFAPRFKIIGLDRPGEPHPPEEAEPVDFDLSSDDFVERSMKHVLEAHGPRIISTIHLAAYYDFKGEPSPLYEQVTVQGTQRLLRALRDFRCEQFIFSSTMLIHAPCEPGQYINEDWRIEPKWDYPKSKVETEALIHRERGNIPAVNLRIAGVYDDYCHSIPLSQQIDRIYRRTLTSHVFPGDTAHGQALLHLEDLLDCFELCAQKRGELPPETNLIIGERNPLSYDELQHTFARLLHGESWETREIPKALAKTGAWLQDVSPMEDPFIKPWMIDLADDHYALDTTRAEQELGWKTKRDLRETIPKMIEALKRDPVKWFKEHELEVPEEVKRQTR